MMATKAMHKLGDISSDVEDLCVIHSETEKDYVGNWVTGLGFIDVKFSKETTRKLTDEEIKKYNSMYYQLADNPPQKMNVNND